jgi:hypothetical protein
MTLEDLHGHTLCEDYCVIKRCDSATSQDVRHRYNRGSCMEKGDAGGFREARKEDEYQYLCGLLGVSPRGRPSETIFSGISQTLTSTSS